MPIRKPKSKSVQRAVNPVPRKPPHRPEHEPTGESRSRVTAMVISEESPDQDMIARRLGISRPTLRKHYRRELDLSYAIIKSEIVGNLVSQARKGDLKAIMFYLETHGWIRSERPAGPAGGVNVRVIVELVG